MNLFDLSGKVAAVIGGASGIGEAIARGAAEQGATVIVFDTNEPAAQSIASRIGGSAARLDIRDARSAEAYLGLALVSYPLHPPGKPEKSRTEHLQSIKVPCLFLSGTRDAFGTVDELEAATAAIPGPVTHVWIEGGDHGLRRRDDEVAAVVRDWVLRL